jgi:serine/threonine protein kinase
VNVADRDMALVGEGFPGEGFPEHVAEVVQPAHERGIVHRDLKPSNMIVIERAGRLLPKLLDFGVAKLLDGELLPESTPDTIKRLRALVVERVPRRGPEAAPCGGVHGSRLRERARCPKRSVERPESGESHSLGGKY